MSPAVFPVVSRDASGFALVEVTVAAAILTVVLIPIAALGAGFMHTPHVRHEVIAFSLARGSMEDALHERAYTDATRRTADGRWRLRRTGVHRDGLVTLTVEVFRTSDTSPRITLMTVRPAEPP